MPGVWEPDRAMLGKGWSLDWSACVCGRHSHLGKSAAISGNWPEKGTPSRSAWSQMPKHRSPGKNTHWLTVFCPLFSVKLVRPRRTRDKLGTWRSPQESWSPRKGQGENQVRASVQAGTANTPRPSVQWEERPQIWPLQNSSLDAGHTTYFSVPLSEWSTARKRRLNRYVEKESRFRSVSLNFCSENIVTFC